MVEAGETGGFLDVVLAQIADFQAREKELRAKVMTALLYPIILLVLATGGADLPAGVLHPAFPNRSLPGSARTLPLLTQMIVGDQPCRCVPTACSWRSAWALPAFLVRTWSFRNRAGALGKG